MEIQRKHFEKCNKLAIKELKRKINKLVKKEDVFHYKHLVTKVNWDTLTMDGKVFIKLFRIDDEIESSLWLLDLDWDEL